MREIFFFILTVFVSFSFSQEKKNDSIPFIDDKYREDQLYISFTYNFINDKPSGISQQGFSGGFQFGFIRDMPLNSKRTIGVGVGLGYATNSYNQNLFIQELDGVVSYSVLDNDVTSYSKNKLNLHIVEMPIQFRWRSSTAQSHKFWRVYTGLKLGYVFHNVRKHKGELGNYKIANLPDVQKLQADLDIGFGWNTWNFYLSYGLRPILKDTTQLNGEVINMSAIKFGLMFYVF